MTSLFAPLMLVALGSASLVIFRDGRAILGALAAQWLGLVWTSALLADTAAPGILGLNRASAVELVTAVVCMVVFGVTVLRRRGVSDFLKQGVQILQPPTPDPRPLTDYLLASAAVLLGGVAGVGFALLFPMGGSAGGVGGLLFYWTVLGSALSLVLDGTRSPIKLTTGLFGLLNGVAYLTITLSIAPPGAALLGMASLTRIALAAMLTYGWALFVPLFGRFDLNVLFSGVGGQGSGVGDEGLESSGPPKQLSPGPDPQPPIPDPQEEPSDE